MPEKVWEALQEGFTITHTGLLLSCPIPSAADIPEVRLVMLALEAVFTFTFWTIFSLEKDFGYGTVSPWKRNSVEYHGCCTHNPFVEGIHGGFSISSEQRLAIAEAVEKKDKAYQREYGRKMRENADDEYRERQRLANAKRAPEQKEIYKVTKASKVFECKVCNVAFRNKSDHERHNATARHKRYVEHGKDGYKCGACGFATKYPSNWKQHLDSAGHKTKTRN